MNQTEQVWLQETLRAWKSTDGYPQKIRKKTPRIHYIGSPGFQQGPIQYRIRSFIKKAFDFSFVQTALYMSEAVHKPQSALFTWYYKSTVNPAQPINFVSRPILQKNSNPIKLPEHQSYILQKRKRRQNFTCPHTCGTEKKSRVLMC